MDYRMAARMAVSTMKRSETRITPVLDYNAETLTIRSAFDNVGGDFVYTPAAFTAWDRKTNLQPMFDEEILIAVILADLERSGSGEDEVYAALGLRGAYGAGGEFIGDERDQHYVYLLRRMAAFLDDLDPMVLPAAASAIREYITHTTETALQDAEYQSIFEEEWS